MNRLTLLLVVAMISGAWVLSPAVVKYIDYLDNHETRALSLMVMAARLRAERPAQPHL